MKVLYAPARQRVPSKAFEWSNGTYSLLLDKLELDFGATLEEDFADSLDFDVTLEEDFSEPLDFTLLLESSQSSHTDEDESSSCGARLLSSSPQAARTRNRQVIATVTTFLRNDKPINSIALRISGRHSLKFIYHPTSFSRKDRISSCAMFPSPKRKRQKPRIRPINNFI
jgi:hypothetical protein